MSFVLPDKAYNVLKWICLIFLPALATLYGVLSKIWNLPFGTEICATITAISTFIGGLIGVSHMNIKRENESEEGL
jgi:fluoride ion exporter CrcB/FEX